MTLPLPSGLVECISRIRMIEGYRIVKERIWMYVQSSPEYFNAALADNITIIRARYGFSPCEHGDWVFPSYCYYGGSSDLDLGTMHPLNSWSLKDPVSLVPSLEKIEEQHEWCAEYVRCSSDRAIKLPTKEDLQERYIELACSELYDYVKLLSLWREARGPREQEECCVDVDRKHLKAVIKAQCRNMLSAKTVMENYKHAFSPSFITDGATARYARETAIYDQLQGVARLC